jgi:hypothetical protein
MAQESGGKTNMSKSVTDTTKASKQSKNKLSPEISDTPTNAKQVSKKASKL